VLNNVYIINKREEITPNHNGDKKMTNFTQTEAIKEIRKEAKDNGMTFKRQNATINGKQAYMFVNRKTGSKVIENCTLWSAYDNCQSGYVAEMKVN